MRIFRYLFKEVNSNFFAVTTMLLLIFLSTRFVRFLGNAAAGDYAGSAIFYLILYRLPSFLEIILPLSLFLGVMLGYGRLYVESEMIILQASGVSKKRLLLYTQGPAVLVMLLVGMCSLYLTPVGWMQYEKLIKAPHSSASFAALVSGTFKKNSSGDMVIYAGSMNESKTELNDVFLVRTPESQSGQAIQIMKAKRGQLIQNERGQRYLEFYDGVQISGELGQMDYQFSNYETAGILIRSKVEKGFNSSDIETVATLDLWGDDSPEAQAALQWRFLMPLMLPIIAMIAMALSETTHRKGRYAKLLPGIIIFFLYLVSLGNARSIIERGEVYFISPLILVHIGFFMLALLIFNFATIKHFLAMKLMPSKRAGS
ncbi:MAG: LPS export ABC transporter permease LptF [Pseudomonadales bacterium]|nr:LPS export ABC transporter permease LptF [Pseudomonadales bacterium]